MEFNGTERKCDAERNGTPMDGMELDGMELYGFELPNGMERNGTKRNGAATEAQRDAAAAKATQNRKKKRKFEKVNRNKEEERAIKAWVDQLPGADLSGYFPLRGDFEHEHDNAAEEVRVI